MLQKLLARLDEKLMLQTSRQMLGHAPAAKIPSLARLRKRWGVSPHRIKKWMIQKHLAINVQGRIRQTCKSCGTWKGDCWKNPSWWPCPRPFKFSQDWEGGARKLKCMSGLL
jgi:hypothetical protein